MVKRDGTPGKKPPAPSARRKPPHLDIKAQIADEIYRALEDLGAGRELLSIVSSWGDTLDDSEIQVRFIVVGPYLVDPGSAIQPSALGARVHRNKSAVIRPGEHPACRRPDSTAILSRQA
jgi:hypothetical protein